MSGDIQQYINAVQASVSINSTEDVRRPTPSKFVRTYAVAYSKLRIPHAFVALDDDPELARDEIRRHLRENYGVTPWARHLLRRFIGEV